MRDGLARPEHGFEPHQLGLRGAVAQDLKATGVRRDGAAHRRAVTTSEINAVRPAGRSCSRLHLGHRGPGTHGKLAPQRVDVADAGQPAQAEHDLASKGDSPANEARVAPLRYERDAGLLAHGDDRRHVGAVPWTYDGLWAAPEAPGPVDGIRLHDLGFDNHVRRTDGPAKLLQQASGHTSILAPVHENSPPTRRRL
jgi:hypothetical protein